MQYKYSNKHYWVLLQLPVCIPVKQSQPLEDGKLGSSSQGINPLDSGIKPGPVFASRGFPSKS